MSREKGLFFVREIRKVLEAMNHQVEGPDYTIAYFDGGPHQVHKDYFGIWDLISFFEGKYYFHQGTTIENKSTKIKAILAKKMNGWVWCRFNEGRRIGYRIFFVDPEKIEEGEIIWRG